MTAALRLVALGLWAGALIAFSAVIVPAAFQVLPGTDLAAELVGTALPSLDRLGAVLALAAVGLGLMPRGPGSARGTADGIRCFLPALGALCHLVSLLWLSPEIRAIREAAGGSVSHLAAADPELVRFGRLHALSIGLVLGAGGTALITALWDAWRAHRSGLSGPDFKKNA